MKSCNMIEGTATIEMTWQVCKDHGEASPRGAQVHFTGVDMTDVMDLAFATLEEALSQHLGDFPPFHAEITKDWGENIGVLPTRAQQHLAKILANIYMSASVVGRTYATHSESALLIIPPLSE